MVFKRPQGLSSSFPAKLTCRQMHEPEDEVLPKFCNAGIIQVIIVVLSVFPGYSSWVLGPPGLHSVMTGSLVVLRVK